MRATTPRFCSPEKGFAQSVEHARWQAYPLGLAMVGEMIEGVLASQLTGMPRWQMLDGLKPSPSFPASTAIRFLHRLEKRPGSRRVRDLAHRLDLAGGHAPKRVMDIPEPLRKPILR